MPLTAFWLEAANVYSLAAPSADLDGKIFRKPVSEQRTIHQALNWAPQSRLEDAVRLNTSKATLMVLMCCFVAMWGGMIDRDVAVAQSRKPLVITRIFTGPDGLAHAEDVELALNARGVSGMLKATGAEFSVRPPTPGANPRNTTAAAANDPGWHTGPARQFVITLSGRSEVEVSGGVHVVAGPGHINLIEDTTGKGHITRNFGPDDRVVLTIPLADGVVIDGVKKPRTR